MNVTQDCWNCGYRKNKQISLFGLCTYFEVKKLEAKDIPPEIADKGCKNWMNKKGAEIIKQIIEKFDGRFINE